MNKTPIYKRILAFILDATFFFLITIFSTVFALKTISTSSFSVELITSLALIAYILVDHIIIPHKTGYTASRWLCSYKIRNITTKENPSYLQCFGRFSTLIILEVIAWVSIVSLATSIFRKDNAAIHDLITKTEVFSIKIKSASRNIKIILIILILTTSHLYGVLTVTSALDEVFVQPVLHKRNETINFTEIPIYKIDSSSISYFTINNFPIIPESNVNNIFYNIEKNQNSSTELLVINNQKFIYYSDEFLNLNKMLKMKWLASLIELNKLAHTSLLSEKGNYKFLSPINNLASYILRVLECVSSSNSRKLVFTTFNNKYFIQYFTITKDDKLRGIDISIFSKESWSSISIISKQYTSQGNDTLLTILESATSINFKNIQEIPSKE